jgi:aspartate aminotransferase-like enzyme
MYPTGAKEVIMIKNFLNSPGPTPVPPEILSDMSLPLIHHRTPEFSNIVKENSDLLKYIFKTGSPVVTFTSSGTGAMEASLTNFLSTGSKILVLSAGKFGERFGEIGRTYGVNVIELKAAYGSDVKPEEAAEVLKNNPDIEAVYTEYSETSTGVAFDVKGLAAIVGKTDAILVVDGITAIGAMEFKMDEWGIDIGIGGSQKSFMIPPGLAFISLSEKARRKMENSGLPKFYFDLAREVKSLEKSTTAWTPAITLFRALNASLKMMKKEGIDNIIQRHCITGEIIRNSVKSIGLELLAGSPGINPSDALTAVKVPGDIDGFKIPGIMRDRYGVTIAGGQGSLKGKIFRLGHLGFVDKSDILIILQAMELTLSDLGYKFDHGKSVSTAQKLIREKYIFPESVISDIGD